MVYEEKVIPDEIYHFYSEFNPIRAHIKGHGVIS